MSCAGVGENFRDHYAPRFVAAREAGHRHLNELARGLQPVGEVARWALARKAAILARQSPIAWSTASGRASKGWTQPDLQCVFTPGSYAEGMSRGWTTTPA